MKAMKRMLCFIMAAVLVTVAVPDTVNAATKVKLNKKTAALTITDKKKSPAVTLKVKGVSKKAARKAKWSTSNKKVATVKKGKVTARKAGKATITCKVKGKKLSCKVTVKDKRKASGNGALKVAIKDMGPVDMTNPDNLKRLKTTGPTEYLKIENDFMTPEQIEFYYTNRKELLATSRSYVVNSRVVATWNGKNITDKAKYSLSLDWMTEKLDKDEIEEGIMHPLPALTTRSYKNPKLIVTYKGKKKEVPLKVTVEKKEISMCYCGNLEYSEEDHERHRSEPGLIFSEHYGGWGFEYYVITIKTK